MVQGQQQKLQLIPLHQCSNPHTELSASLENVHEATRHGDQEVRVFYNLEQFLRTTNVENAAENAFWAILPLFQNSKLQKLATAQD